MIPFYKPIIHFSVLIFALVFSQTNAFAQRNELAKKHFEQARDYLAAGNIKAGKKALKTAISLNPQLLNAHFKLGTIFFDEKNWGKACKHFDKILELDPDNTEAHYYSGMSWRERGTTRQLLFGDHDWRLAAEHFQQVMASDSTYKDVIYQLALLKRYEKKYTEAIALCYDQIRLRPDLLAPQVELYNFYRFLIKHKSQKKAFAWLNRQSFQEAQFFIAEKFRRDSRFSEADSVLQHLLKLPRKMPHQPIYLSLARIQYARKNSEKAENFYWRAVNTIQTSLGAELLFEDVKYIVTPAELDHFRSLTSISENKAFFHALWEKRDPTPAARNNLRLAEHVRRILYAEKNYEFDGFRNSALTYDPLIVHPIPSLLNGEFCDRGAIYIRHGEPNEKVNTVMLGPVPNYISWLYEVTRQNSRLTFHFKNAGMEYTLTAALPFPKVLEDRYMWDPIYFQINNAMSEKERFVAEEKLAEKGKEDVIEGLTTDRHSWDEKIEHLDMPMYTATFRGEQGETILEIYYGIPVLDVVKSLPDSAEKIMLEDGVALHDKNWKLIKRIPRTATIPFNRNQVKPDDLYFDSFKVSLPPDSFNLALHAKPEYTHLVAGHQGLKINIPDYSGKSLSLSDFILASDIRPALKMRKFTRNGLLVIPKPTLSFDRKKPMMVYFEIYNLSRDDDHNTAFSVEYELTSMSTGKKLFGLLGRRQKSVISVIADHQGKTPDAFEFIGIDTGKLKKGEYELTLKIMDRHTGEKVEKKRQVTLY